MFSNRISKEKKNKIINICENNGLFEKSGKNYKLRCPFHKEKTPSCTISPEFGVYHCFGCGKGGSFNELYIALGYYEVI